MKLAERTLDCHAVKIRRCPLSNHSDRSMNLEIRAGNSGDYADPQALTQSNTTLLY